MEKVEYGLESAENPCLDTEGYKDFNFNFRRALLLSLLEGKKLTQSQFEACMDKISRKWGFLC